MTFTKNVRELDSRDTNGIHVRTLWDLSQEKTFLEVVTDAGIATVEIPAREVVKALHHPALYVDIPTESLIGANDLGIPENLRTSLPEALRSPADSFDRNHFDPTVIPLEDDDTALTTLERLGWILNQFDEGEINYVEFVQEANRIYEDGISETDD